MNQLDTPAVITENLGLWASAIQQRSTTGRGSSKKIDLYGIKKLRELILELAVRGKLVPQNPEDERASLLLEHFAAEKALLIKDKKIKKSKKLPEVTVDDHPFKLPEQWAVARLGELSLVITKGTTPTSVGYQFTASGVSFIKVENIANNRIQKTAISQHISEETHAALERSSLEAGDVLFSIAGTIGKTCIVTKEDLPANTNQALAIIKGTSLVFDVRFLLILLNSFVASKTKEKARGGAMPNVSLGDLTHLVAIVPPQTEQHRIVTKVNELMSLCDQLEQQTETSLAAHTTLVENLLATLTNSGNAEELEQNWHRIAEHFTTLFTTEESIDQLKQTVLQLAVMGKLVPQASREARKSPDYEPASVLLEKIAAEKAQLIKEKKVKKQKALPPVGEDEKPFGLPVGWEWERIGTFSQVGTGATPSRAKPEYWSDAEINWVSSGETSELYVADTKEKVSITAVKETNVTVYPKGTLVIAMYGQGKTRGQITELLVEAGTNQACAAIRLFEKHVDHRAFVKLFFIKAYEELRSAAAGGAQPNLNVAKVASTVLPIPPLEEQCRITIKVKQLMILCNQLKTHLQQVQQNRLHLADAMVEGALA
ncbi:restriction endonuclease subunit S [Endozoicomonas arenosclerae]|uniref:restriction endonuclease subunit S n=1 Tax=Endozoicomonas arenosclerae TaxID=1633495 RepID=UPI000780D221|nr:restriction endonuclease subunit S [Endozoicomonas arenosclerae]